MEYDEINASVKATVTIKTGDILPKINGKTLTAGTYVFWYENEKSLTTKLNLIEKYNLKGSGSWSLGQENPSTWNYYGKVVNGEKDEENKTHDIVNTNEFIDVPSNYWAYEAIKVSKEKGWITGRSENFFEPEGTLTRAEFATLITRVMGYKYDEKGDFYLDIKNHWANKSINAVTMNKVMNGYNNGLFKPDNTITREEVAKVLALLVKEENNLGMVEYKDVEEDRWSYESIQKLSSLGIFIGYDDGTFRPQQSIKRSEMVTLLSRFF